MNKAIQVVILISIVCLFFGNCAFAACPTADLSGDCFVGLEVGHVGGAFPEKLVTTFGDAHGAHGTWWEITCVSGRTDHLHPNPHRKWVT